MPGRIAPTRIAEVRARVSGIVVNRNFEQGTDVKAGDVLYELDARPFEIDVSRPPEAALADRADRGAAARKGRTPSGAGDARAARATAQSQCDIAIAHAARPRPTSPHATAVARARLNLDYTRSARRSAAASAARWSLKARWSVEPADACRHDPATRSGLCRLHAVRRRAQPAAARIRTGGLEETRPRGCGSFSITASIPTTDLLFSDSTVDPGTGQVTLRGEFPNPKMALLPGTYVRVQIVQGIDPDALSVPQQAVRRNDAGRREVFVVRDDNRATLAPARLGHAVDDRWLVLDGVKPGDRVIVDGFQKFSAAMWSIRSRGRRTGGRSSRRDIGRHDPKRTRALKDLIDASFFHRPPGLRFGPRSAHQSLRRAGNSVPWPWRNIRSSRHLRSRSAQSLSGATPENLLQQRHAADRGGAQRRQRHPQFRIDQQFARPGRDHCQFRSGTNSGDTSRSRCKIASNASRLASRARSCSRAF